MTLSAKTLKLVPAINSNLKVVTVAMHLTGLDPFKLFANIWRSQASCLATRYYLVWTRKTLRRNSTRSIMLAASQQYEFSNAPPTTTVRVRRLRDPPPPQPQLFLHASLHRKRYSPIDPVVRAAGSVKMDPAFGPLKLHDLKSPGSKFRQSEFRIPMFLICYFMW